MGYKEGDELIPKNEDGTKVLLSDIHFLQTWKALEEAVYKQKIRSIGVSNFNKEQIQLIWENCKIKPSVLQVGVDIKHIARDIHSFLQVEIHPYFQQEDLVKFCKNLGICVTAYSPLGSSNLNPFKKTDYPSIYTDPIINEIARKYNKVASFLIYKNRLHLLTLLFLLD
jgi:diketogulonate reductase-like aldo/keto reductase